ncbi:MAG: cytoplasmic protein [Bacillota bacterium]
MSKFAFFAFRGDLMCFQHVLLNALDLDQKGNEVKIIFEGESVTLIEKLEKSTNKHYVAAKEKGLIDCACKACSASLGVLEFNESTDIPLKGDMSGHPSMESYIKNGYEIITL